jgi:hypothetical protein
MKPEVYFVVGVDADPKRSSFGANDDDLMEKYSTAFALLKRAVGSKSIICVHTSPLYRDRFFRPPFIHFWEDWVGQGGELMLHPEEDLYPLPEGPIKDGTYYKDSRYMERILKEKIEFMREKGLPCAAFRGAFFGLTEQIVGALTRLGVEIDLSCAPGIVLPERAADWADAPASGYYMSRKSYRRPTRSPGGKAVFEIPLGWDGQGKDLTENYLFHERSTLKKMSGVWNAIVKRSEQTGSPQFVGFLCHTFSMGNARLRTQCENILSYMQEHGGIPVSASEGKKLYHKLVIAGALKQR